MGYYRTGGRNVGNPYTIACTSCGATTTKHYAREHSGQCKACSTGAEPGFTCPTCGTPGVLSAYEKSHHYHCHACTRATDPEGYRREVMGYNDGPDY